MLTPYREAKFEPHTGPFLFEFQRHGMSSEEFCSRVDTFFSQLPKDFRYAVEIRNSGLLGPDYRKVLEHHGVAHVYNHWFYMPPLREQHQRMEERFTAPFTVLRLLTPLNMSYETAKKRAEPYTKIVETLPEMRRDTVDLVKKAMGENRKAYVLVNNRSEGNAPLTIQALRTALQASETSALPLSIFGLSWQRELEGVEDATAFAARAESGGVNVGPAHGSLDRLVQVCNSGFATHQNPAPSQPPRINVAPDLKYSPYRNFMASFATNLSTNTGL